MAQDPAVDTTLAILAGASIYKRSKELAQGKRFEDSAREFREYSSTTLRCRRRICWTCSTRRTIPTRSSSRSRIS